MQSKFGRKAYSEGSRRYTSLGEQGLCSARHEFAIPHGGGTESRGGAGVACGTFELRS